MTLQCECIADFELITIITCSLIFPDSCFCKFQLCTPRLLCFSHPGPVSHLFPLLSFLGPLFLFFLLLCVFCHGVSPLQPQRTSRSAGARLSLSGLDDDPSSASSSPDLVVSAKRQLTSLQTQSHYLQPSSCSST